MALYWVYLDGSVAGPYELDQIVRLRGFSRQTLVCIDDASGKPKNWISPADIPELAHIFKAVDDQRTQDPPALPSKPANKPGAPRPAPKRSGPAVFLRRPAAKSYRSLWVLLAAGLLGAGGWLGSQALNRRALAGERQAARALVENAPLPADSLYRTLHHYLQEKGIQPRWEFERMEEALYHVTASWYGRDAATVYAFEVNVQAQTVRGLNTAASRLLSDGFPTPRASKSPVAPPHRKSPNELFAGALDERRQAFENGDFQSVWDSFSRRKKMEMTKAGMSRDGFIRLQTLTYHVDASAKQAVLKTKDDSDSQKLVLLKQSQAHHPDIFVKQLWIWEDEAWRLDDEEKRAVEPQAKPAAPPIPAALPGMSN